MMKYAKIIDGTKSEVSYSGQRGKCLLCNTNVIGKKGKIKVSHWAHEKIKNCDSWYEPMTQWHINWQNKFPKKNQEVILFDKSNNQKHIADIKLENDIIIEVQNSNISIDEINEREFFYNKLGNLIWILNGETLLTKSSISYKKMKKDISIYIYIVPYFDLDGKYYEFDDVREDFLNSKLIKELKSDRNDLIIKVSNGTSIELNFDKITEILLKEYMMRIKICIKKILIDYYGEMAHKIYKEYDLHYKYIKEDAFYKIKLIKKYWRKFIDKIESPIFIDNLNGTPKEYIYWLQKNKFIFKYKFIEKYNKYT